MSDLKQVSILKTDSMSAVRAVAATLRKIDERLMDHGERVGYIACELCKYGKLGLDLKTLFLLGLFHDIGAYKTDEIDRMLEFETKDVKNHAVYGYLFLKHLSPLSESASAILYHHSSWKQIQQADSKYKDYAALLHLADRMDISGIGVGESERTELFEKNAGKLFKPEYVRLMLDYTAKHPLYETLKNESYKNANTELLGSMKITPDEVLKYIEMIVLTIDFRSENTVTHSINTISIAVNLGRHRGLCEDELNKIYLASLLHDVGKITTPIEILDFPGRLDDEKMKIMRMHVTETEKLIRGVVSDEICDIAVRHHEKLDGSGYPRGLKAEDLTLSQRIVEVADIVSALNSHRSYKDPFPKERIISILNDMSREKLDKELCDYFTENCDAILSEAENERQNVIEKYQSIFSEFEKIKKQSF